MGFAVLQVLFCFHSPRHAQLKVLEIIPRTQSNVPSWRSWDIHHWLLYCALLCVLLSPIFLTWGLPAFGGPLTLQLWEAGWRCRGEEKCWPALPPSPSLAPRGVAPNEGLWSQSSSHTHTQQEHLGRRVCSNCTRQESSRRCYLTRTHTCNSVS